MYATCFQQFPPYPFYPSQYHPQYHPQYQYPPQRQEPHMASFEELKTAVGAPHYSTSEFSFPLTHFRLVSGKDAKTGRPYSKLEFSGRGYTVPRKPADWCKKQRKPFQPIPKPVHISVPGHALPRDFLIQHPHITVIVLEPPRTGTGGRMDTHTAPVLFGLSHDAPEGTEVPPELKTIEKPHVTLSSFIIM